jgi:hypothetical protein
VIYFNELRGSALQIQALATGDDLRDCCMGASLAYLRNWWLHHPFPDKQVGDVDFTQTAINAGQMYTSEGRDKLIMRILDNEGGNTASRDPSMTGELKFPFPLGMNLSSSRLNALLPTIGFHLKIPSPLLPPASYEWTLIVSLDRPVILNEIDAGVEANYQRSVLATNQCRRKKFNGSLLLETKPISHASARIDEKSDRQ